MEDNEKMMEEMELKAQVKAAEDKRRQENLKKAAPRKVEELRMHFDSWYALRSQQFPKKHYKEILKADFTARGLSEKEACASYDAALNKYGVKLSK